MARLPERIVPLTGASAARIVITQGLHVQLTMPHHATQLSPVEAAQLAQMLQDASRDAGQGKP